MSGVSPEIKTKFTLSGLREASTGLNRFAQDTRSKFTAIKKSASDAFKPAEADIKRLHRSMALLKTGAIGGVSLGFRGLEKTATASLRAVKISAIAATTAVAGIGFAAVKSAKDSAAELAKINDDSKRYGVSTEDLSVLEFAGKREGLESDTVNVGIVKMSESVRQLRDRTAEANKEFDRLRNNARGDALIALLNRDKDGVVAAGDAVAKARPNSKEALDVGISRVQSKIAELDVFKSGETPAQRRARAIALWERRKQLQELEKAQRDYVDSLGPEGKAIDELQAHGLDMEKAMKGGVEGFIALGDAIRRVEDPAQRLSYSIAFFGTKAGPKMLPLLMQGRKGIEDYRKELERLGGVVTKSDAEMGSAFGDSTDALKRSVSGIRLQIGRELIPSMIDLNKKGTEFLVRYRANIAQFVKAGFDGARNLGADAIDVFGGKRSGFRTEWLDTAFTKFRALKAAVADFRKEVSLAFEGGDSKYEWLNAVATGLKTAKKFAEDIFAVFKGKDAKNFAWINELRDWLRAFFKDVQVAFGLFKDVLKLISDYIIGPIAKLLNTDIVATAMFIGMLRFSGILGVVLKTLSGIAKVGKGAFAVAGAAAGIGAAAPVAAGAAGALARPAASVAAGAVGAAAAGGAEARIAAVSAGALTGIRATTTSALAAVSRIGAGMLAALSSFATAASIVWAGWETGKFLAQKASDWSGLTAQYEKTQQMAAALAKIKSDRSLADAYTGWDLDRKKAFQSRTLGISYDSGFRRNEIFSHGDFDMSGNALNRSPDKTIALKLDLNGKQATVTGRDGPDMAAIIAEAERLSRMNGGY